MSHKSAVTQAMQQARSEIDFIGLKDAISLVKTTEGRKQMRIKITILKKRKDWKRRSKIDIIASNPDDLLTAPERIHWIAHLNKMEINPRADTYVRLLLQEWGLTHISAQMIRDITEHALMKE